MDVGVCPSRLRWIVPPETETDAIERVLEPQPAATVAAQHVKRTAASLIAFLYVTALSVRHLPSGDIPEYWAGEGLLSYVGDNPVARR
jgi:hypothetical protein